MISYLAAYLLLVEREVRRQDLERAAEAERAILSAADGVLGRRAGTSRGMVRGSASGAPPAMRSGALKASVRPLVEPGAVLNARIEAGAGYAGFLENGTRKMGARPFKERILKLAEPKLVEIDGRVYRLPPAPEGILAGRSQPSGGWGGW